MKAYDMIHKQELELDRKALIDLMIHDRQVDLTFDQVRSDADGYILGRGKLVLRGRPPLHPLL